jgi:hypothetical protein
LRLALRSEMRGLPLYCTYSMIWTSLCGLSSTVRRIIWPSQPAMKLWI